MKAKYVCVALFNILCVYVIKLWYACFNVLVRSGFLKCNRYSSELEKLLSVQFVPSIDEYRIVQNSDRVKLGRIK